MSDAAYPQSDLGVVGDLYHKLVSGFMLGIAQRAGTVRGAEIVFRAFRRQQKEKFLPGLDKLGLADKPHAVACAQYHYLSNALGGAKVEWIPETDTKSWVRYLPPRWIYDGTAICGIPTEMSRAMMQGWHANNGRLLGNPRLGFVCTSQTTDGQPGAIGYYIEEDHDLAPEERLRFAPGERPPGPAGDLPSVNWSGDRLAKVKRNYSMEYVRSLLTAACAVLGPADGGQIGRIVGRQVGMQFHDWLCDSFGHDMEPDDPAASAAMLLHRLAAAQDDAPEVATQAGEARLTISKWRFGRGLDLPPEGFEAWNGLIEGIVMMHGRRPGLSVQVVQRQDLGDPVFEWRIRPSG
ncbi:MAG: hypothetical protein ACU0CX_11245 [Sagittula sp.]|uniref:hypothetical protein n=1 Tax=Sagittula sp. TaxID=2038081 RepID=UPI0040580842